MLSAILLMLYTFSALLQSVEYRVLHDARAVHDIASLRFQNFQINGAPFWVIATTIPGSKSGSSTIPGAYIKTDSGTLVAPKNAEVLLLKEGSWKRLAATGKTPEVGTYSWTEALQVKRILQAEDFYSPFTHGGTIIFRYTPGAAGIEQFGTVLLIFPDWHGYVEPAFTFMSSHPVFQRDGHVRRSEVPRLTQLLSQDNKLLAALAFRELVASDQITPQLVRNQLTHADVDLGAIYTYLGLTSPEGNRQKLVQEIAGIARTTQDRAKLRSIALGAFAAGLLRTNDSETVSSSKSVLRAIRQRLNDLNIAVGDDPYLALIFEKMGQ